MEITATSSHVKISIRVNDLMTAAEGSDKYRVTFPEEFAEEFAKTLSNYQTQNSKETGITALQEFFDNIFTEMVESGSYNIVSIKEHG